MTPPEATHTAPPREHGNDPASFHAPRRFGTRATYLLPLIVGLALCTPKLWQGGWSTDTPWYAAIALNAFRSAAHGDLGALWTLPGIGAEPYFNKPPLAFWLNGPWLWALGPGILAARLGSVIACLACVALTTHLARRAADNFTGLLAGLILALTWEFVRHARSFSLDLWMVAFILLGLVGVIEFARRGALEQSRSDISTAPAPTRTGASLLLLGVGIGLALLTKPLIALLVFPIIAAWLIWDRPARDSIHRHSRWPFWLLAAFALSLLIATPWHLSMASLHGDAFTSQYFGREIADRAAGDGGGRGADFNKQAAHWWFYVSIIIKSSWPWLITTLLAFAALASRSLAPAARSVLRFTLLWTIVWLIVLSIFPDKRPRYALVLYPIWAWASAMWIAGGPGLAPPAARRAGERAIKPLVVACALLALVASLTPIRLHGNDSPQWAALFAKLESLAPDSSTPPNVYAGALVGQRAARLYLQTARWPIPTHDAAGRLIHDPPVGALILYHRRDGRAPGPSPGEVELWRDGDLSLTRLDAPPWRPFTTADTGER